MRNKLHKQFFLFIAVFLGFVLSYATIPQLYSHLSNQLIFKDSTNNFIKNSIDDPSLTSIKPSVNISNRLFVIEEIPVEEVNKKEENLSIRIKKSVFELNSCAILYKVLFENATLKTKENSLYQKIFATHVALNLYKKFEVYRI